MVDDRFTLGPQSRVLLADLGISVPDILRRAGLPDATFARGTVSLSRRDYFAFWRALDEEADDPSLAVRMGQSISPEVFDPPIFAALSSPNLAVAADRIAHFKALIGPMRLRITSTASNTVLENRWPDGEQPPDLLAVFELVHWVSLVRIATRADIRPLRITAPVRLSPEQADAIERFAGSAVEFTPVHSITFSGRDAEHPFLSANDSMWEALEPQLLIRLADVDERASTTELVRAALVQLLPAGSGTMAGVAEQLVTSPRTLQRHLGLESTTFQAELRATRQALALNYLAMPRLTAGEIALLLGYDDTNSFYRAFRSWTGHTPERARELG